MTSKKKGELLAAKVVNKWDKNETSTKKLASSEHKILRLLKGKSDICRFK